MEKLKDDRFSHISSDPRFKAAPKSVRKVKIDNRFQSLFTDKRFQVQYTVDKRGKQDNRTSHENFRKYYELSSEDENSEDSDRDKKDIEENSEDSDTDKKDIEEKKAKKTQKLLSNENESESIPNHITETPKTNKWIVTSSALDQDKNINGPKLSSNNLKIKANKKKEEKNHIGTDDNEKTQMTDEIKTKLRDPNIDYARGVGILVSDSSSEEESSGDSESEEESDEEHGWGELDRDAEVTEEATDRLAVLHMDWDRIRAVDLMVLFNSFLPPEGVIESVTIYPSQFGLERMKEEEEKGPTELVNMKIEDKAELDEESKDGKRYHMERLRQYQLNRLKYYYAVIKFDSANTANKVYAECDNLEYESSATKLDLRFVPDGETFEQEPKEACTGMPDPAKYEPRIFTNTALQQGKVELTWDEMDPGRLEFTKKIQKNADKIDDADLEAYLASSSGEEDDNKNVNAASNDVESSEEDEKEEDRISRYKSLLVSLKEEEEQKKNKDVDLEITWGVGLKEKAEKSIKEKLNAPQTPFEELLEKRRQKKKLKKENKLKLKENNQEGDSEDALDSDDDIPSDVDMNDPYFKEELQESKKKKKIKVVDNKESEESEQRKAELELLLLDEDNTETNKGHFNFKSIEEQENKKSKKRRRKQLKKKHQDVLPEKDDFEVDVKDARFSALFTSHHFNVDPADPQFRNTKSMQAIHSEKLKRRHQELKQEILPEKQPKMDPELSLLVRSIKNKAKHKLKK